MSTLITATVVSAGVCTPCGTDLDSMWQALLQGGSEPSWMSFPLTQDWVTPAYIVDRIPVVDDLTPQQLRRLDRHHLLALDAATEALNGLRLPAPDRCGVVVGIGFGEGPFAEQQASILRDVGPRRVSPLTIPLAMPNSTAALLAAEFGFQGPALSVATACASGTDSIGLALDLLARGDCDLVLAGGVDSLVHASPMSGFDRLGATTKSRDIRPSRPFDERRDGFVMGEGAGFLALTRSADGVKGGCLGTILAYASTTGAAHVLAPSDDGAVAMRAIELAMERSDVSIDEIGHVNAHGSSTQLNDRIEARILAKVFGQQSVPVTATKGATGHMIGASGSVECIATLQALRSGQVPPIGGLERPFQGIEIDVVLGEPRNCLGTAALSCSFGFGGHNSAIVVSTADSEV